jgi:CHAT domain-containing protein
MLFDPLPGATREVRDVVRIWSDAHGPGEPQRPAETLVGDDAGETEFRLQSSGKRILHLATHGFFLGGDCGSVLDAGAAAAGVTRENPLLLSGLVFAGANSRDSAGPDEDDGILTAEEISTLDLRAADWAVLSACDTATGEIRVGEGVLGLQRAFKIAGARTTIMSLWPVEDEATRRWMTALYRHHLIDGQSTADSVRSAHLDLLAERRAKGSSTHPFYWAGFVASGAWH